MDLRTELELIIEQAKRERCSIIDLENKHLKRLPSTIGDLPNLAELNLRCNQLATVPDNIGNLLRLVRLNLRCNQLTSLPDGIGNLSNLVKLNLRYNQLTSLPESIGNLSKLTHLDLGYNQLSALADSFRNLSNLASISIDFNPIKDLSLLQDLPKLQSVYFFDKLLSRRYWAKFSDWKPEWFLDEDDREMRRALIENVGSEKIIQQIGVVTPEFGLSELSENICNFTNLTAINLAGSQIASLPENIVNLSSLRTLEISNNQLSFLPKSIGNLSNLVELNLRYNQLTSLPDSITNLSNLTNLYLCFNQLTSLPDRMENLSSLSELYLDGNSFVDLSSLKNIISLKNVYYFGIDLPRRYWDKFSDWKPEWLLDEDNAEIRRVLVEQVGYEKICKELSADNIDVWREYTLLKIDGVEAVYDEDEDEPIDREPMVLLKMTCPSTEHIHILRVPPEMTSAEAAITWVNHGIHPDKFAVQT